MTTFSRTDDLQGAEFVGVDLRDARFIESDLTGVVMRGVEVTRTDIDAPWLPHSGFFRINGVDVIPLVEAELDRRFPGRDQRRAGDPDGLRAAWAAVERTWSTTLERAEALPPGAVEVSVDGEWSFAQTLRHLVQATDIWLGRAVLRAEEPYHPIGLKYEEPADVDAARPGPSYAEVLEVRAGRVAMVRDFLATVTSDDLDAPRSNPHHPDRAETVRSCLHVILEEEWEHHRFAIRDLESISSPDPTPVTG